MMIKLILWGLAAGVLVSTAWNIRNLLRGPERQRSLQLSGLRGIAALLMAMVLIQPQFRRRESVPEKPLIGVLVDSSQSMNDGNRAKVAREWLESSTFRKARETCDLRFFSIDHSLQETVPGEIAFKGAESRINDALGDWSKRWSHENAAGMVLISDGLDTGGRPPQTLSLPCWVMEVEPAVNTTVARVALWQVEPPRRPVAGAENSVRVVLQGWGVDDKDIPVELWSEGRKVGEKRVRFTHRGDVDEVMLPIKPEKPGSYPYEIRVADPAADASAKSQPFVVSVRQEGRSVLLLSNTLGFEGKFLRRALSTDRNVRLDSYTRWKDGRWASLGDGGDQTKNTLDLSASALSTRAAVVLADVSSESLNPVEWQALSDYAGKGGGLVVLGGPNLLASPQTSSTIGRVLPVPTPAPHFDGRFGVKLTDAGSRHSVFGPLFEAVKDFPALQGVNFATGVAGNAQVLMETVVDGRTHPLVVVKQQGSGRIAVVLSDTLWRWRVAAPGWTGRLSAYDTFWCQLLDWLAPDMEGLQSGGRIELTADKPFYDQNDNVSILAEWIGKGVAPYGSLDATVKNPDGKTQRVNMTPSVWQNSDGRRVTGFRGEIVVKSTGVYQTDVRAEWTGGEVDVSMRFAVTASPGERRGESPDIEFLRNLAKQSSGGYFMRKDADKWLEALPSSRRITEREVVTDVWNHPLIAMLLLGCLCGEWWIRRRRGLA